MTRRRLTQDEIDLWHKVAEQAERLHPGKAPPRPTPKPKPSKPVVARTMHPEPHPRPGPRPPVPKPRTPAVKMDHKAFTRMRRGKLKPEARIDLHGMTLDRAHPELIRFILNAHASGKRLVLVITGKGRSTEMTPAFAPARGVLKRQVPLWLAMPPLAHLTLQVNAAHISHGGDGALYVYLRRDR